jgi:hypothetical protein
VDGGGRGGSGWRDRVSVLNSAQVSHRASPPSVSRCTLSLPPRTHVPCAQADARHGEGVLRDASPIRPAPHRSRGSRPQRVSGVAGEVWAQGETATDARPRIPHRARPRLNQSGRGSRRSLPLAPWLLGSQRREGRPRQGSPAQARQGLPSRQHPFSRPPNARFFIRAARASSTRTFPAPNPSSTSSISFSTYKARHIQEWEQAVGDFSERIPEPPSCRLTCLATNDTIGIETIPFT